jgi:site-specific DNA recombinase
MPARRKDHAAIYVRISRDREGLELGVQRQEEDCRKLAARRGVKINRVFCDNDISASPKSTKPRPDYQRMLAEVDAGRIGTVLAYSTSRLTRRPMEFEGLINRAERGLTIATVSIGQVDLTTANGQMVARILAAADAREAMETAERVKRAKEQARANGGYIGGPRAFGWRPGYTEPDPVESELVLAAVDDVLSGRSLGGIAARWQEAAGGTPAGKRWRPNAVRAVLRNPRHAGLTRDGVKAPHDGIVGEDRWRGLLAVLDDPARRVRARSTPRHLLTGIALCGKCGATIQSGTSGGAAYRLYRCSAANHLARAAEPVDDRITTVLLAYLVRERVGGRKPADVGPLAREAVGLRAQLDQLATLLTQGVLTEAGVRAESVRLRGQLDALDAQMADLARGNALAGVPLEPEVIAAWWENDTDLEERRAVLLATPMNITLHSPGMGARPFDPKTVTIDWKGRPR